MSPSRDLELNRVAENVALTAALCTTTQLHFSGPLRPAYLELRVGYRTDSRNVIQRQRTRTPRFCMRKYRSCTTLDSRILAFMLLHLNLQSLTLSHSFVYSAIALPTAEGECVRPLC